MIFPAAWGYGSENAAAALPIPTDKVRKDRGEMRDGGSLTHRDKQAALADEDHASATENLGLDETEAADDSCRSHGKRDTGRGKGVALSTEGEAEDFSTRSDNRWEKELTSMSSVDR